MTEATRALDAEVATKVMGWTVELIVNPVGDAFEEWRDPQGWRYGPNPPPYSDEISEAWKVAEHLKLWVFSHDGEWYAGLESHYGVYVDSKIGEIDGHLDYVTSADTAPLAICMAALAAVGHPVSGADKAGD